MTDSGLKDAVTEELLERLANGDGLVAICRADRMPNRSTVQRWQDADPDFDAAVTRAREIGMHVRAELAVENAKTASDASLGRLAFDAERWYVGKLSNAFADKLKHVGGEPGDQPIQTVTRIERHIIDPDTAQVPAVPKPVAVQGSPRRKG